MLTLIEQFVNSAEKHAEKLAVIQDSCQITYRDLYVKAHHYKNIILENGIQPGDRVAIYAQNSIDYISCYYGIWLASAVVVALNTESKSKDVLNWVKHSGSRLLFLDSKISESRNIFQEVHDQDEKLFMTLDIANLGNCEEWLENENLVTVYPTINSVASIIYTSGTTGHPKGVTLTHRNVSANMGSIISYLPISADDVFINVLPFFYSYGNSVLHTHLLTGATIVLVNSLMFPNKVLQAIDDYRATSISGVPSTFLLLLGRTNIDDYDLHTLKYITQAGGPMAPSTTQEIMKKIPHVDIFIMYGQTEATARLSYLPPDMLQTKMSSIGKPIPGVELCLRNDDEQVSEFGKEGVIFAKGDNIMQGYWNDEALTNTVIGTDGWLNTGDIAKQDKDGFYYIVGRKTEMIKTGANRISPKEIEEILLSFPGVHECAVIGVDDELLGQAIKAYIVSNQNLELNLMKIKKYCKDNLANYKVPKYVELINELPKTSSGKIKKYLLN